MKAINTVRLVLILFFPSYRFAVSLDSVLSSKIQRKRSLLSHLNLGGTSSTLDHRLSSNDNINTSNSPLEQRHGEDHGIIKHNFRGGSLLPQTHRRRLVVLLVATALFNDMLQLTMLLPIIHTLVTNPPPLGVAASKISNENAVASLGLFFASKDICQMAFAPLAGILTSKTSSNVALMLSTAGLGLATFVFAEATTFRQLLMARGAQGAASAAVLCGGMSLIAETHEQSVRGSAIGLAQSGLALGLLCGPLIGGLLFEQLGRKKTFRLAAAIVLFNSAAQLGLMCLAPPEKVVDEQYRKRNTDESKSVMQSTKKLLSNRDILVVIAATLVIHAVVGVIKPLSQVVLDEEFGVTMVMRSFIISIATVTYFVSTPLSGWLSDRSSRSGLVALSLLIMSGSAAFFALRSYLGIGAFYVSVGLLGVAMGFSMSSGHSLLADLVDRSQLGDYSMAYALSDVADSLGLILGPILGLYLAEVFNASAGVLAVGSLCLLLAPIVYSIK